MLTCNATICWKLIITPGFLKILPLLLMGEPKAVDVEIHSSMEKSAINVDENEIKEAYYKAMSAYENEMTFDDFHNPIGTYDYSLVGENETYFYEQTADDSVRPHMDIFVLSDEEKLAQKTDYAERLLAEMGMARSSTGYFGKMYVEKNDNADYIPFVFIRTPQYKKNGFSRIKNMTSFYTALFKVAKEYCRSHDKPDLIFASSVHPLTLVAGIKLSKKLGIKCICEVRDLWPESFVAYGKLNEKSLFASILYKGENWIYKKAGALIFTMEGGKNYIKDKKWDKKSGGSIDLQKVY